MIGWGQHVGRKQPDVKRCETGGGCPVQIETHPVILRWRHDDGRCEGCGRWK